MKEQEIAQRIVNGASPSELINEGYSRGTVYKVNRRLSQAGTTPSNGSVVNGEAEAEIEQDPEVVELKKALRRAQLQRQIDALQGKPDWIQRIQELEDRVATLEEYLALLDEAVGELI